ncbi:hypothetical protein LTR70_004644 [Exophiala xenobiotica]|nr:hypothetical protein LTR70_004644 [Exophiala xenobiotica]
MASTFGVEMVYKRRSAACSRRYDFVPKAKPNKLVLKVRPQYLTKMSQKGKRRDSICNWGVGAVVGGDVRIGSTRRIIQEPYRKPRKIEIYSQHVSLSEIGALRGYTGTLRDGERKIHNPSRKAPKWRAVPDKVTPDFEVSLAVEGPRYRRAGYESQGYVKDNVADFNSQEETLRGTSTRESVLTTEAPHHHLPSKVRTRSSGVSDESRSRPTAQQHAHQRRSQAKIRDKGQGVL